MNRDNRSGKVFIVGAGPGIEFEERADLPECHCAAADNEAGKSPHVYEDREVCICAGLFHANDSIS